MVNVSWDPTSLFVPTSITTGRHFSGLIPAQAVYRQSLPTGMPIPKTPRSPNPKMRSPSVTTTAYAKEEKAGSREIWKCPTFEGFRAKMWDSSSIQGLTETFVSGQLSRIERMCPLSWMDMNNPLVENKETRANIKANTCPPPKI